MLGKERKNAQKSKEKEQRRQIQKARVGGSGAIVAICDCDFRQDRTHHHSTKMHQGRKGLLNLRCNEHGVIVCRG